MNDNITEYLKNTVPGPVASPIATGIALAEDDKAGIESYRDCLYVGRLDLDF